MALSTPTHWRCPRCHAKNGAKTKYCHHCGGGYDRPMERWAIDPPPVDLDYRRTMWTVGWILLLIVLSLTYGRACGE